MNISHEPDDLLVLVVCQRQVLVDIGEHFHQKKWIKNFTDMDIGAVRGYPRDVITG